MTTQLISERFSRDAARAGVASLPPVLAVQERQIPYINAFVSKLDSGEYSLVHSPCPCGSEPDDVVISETDRYGLPLSFVLCLGCGTIRIDPYLDEPSVEDFYVHLYQQMYRRTANLDREFERQRNYGRRILTSVKSWLRPGGTVFEVGCGGGGGLEPFAQAGYEVGGQDYSQELIDYGRSRGIENLHQGSLEEIAGRGVPEADLIYLHHVLEHVDDPVAMLIACKALLRDGGRVVVIVPDIAHVDRFAYPGGDLLPFLHVAHKFNFSAEGMRRVVRCAGYRDAEPIPARDAAEMWVEIVPGEKDARYDGGEAGQAGKAMLDRLRRIERLHRLGLSRGQFLRRRDVALERLKAIRGTRSVKGRK
jgi:SAM-dependent methyltransferase